MGWVRFILGWRRHLAHVWRPSSSTGLYLKRRTVQKTNIVTSSERSGGSFPAAVFPSELKRIDWTRRRVECCAVRDKFPCSLKCGDASQSSLTCLRPLQHRLILFCFHSFFEKVFDTLLQSVIPHSCSLLFQHSLIFAMPTDIP